MPHRIPSFLQAEKGSMTYWGLFTIITLMMMGGYAIDVQNAMRERTHLQMVADTAAHSALLTREFKSREDAVATALQVTKENMPVGAFGNVVGAQDIVFGTWNPTTRTFTANVNAKSAVSVTAHRSSDNGNSLGTYLLRLVGRDAWDINVKSIYTTYKPTCFREGFVAEGVVDIQSNNSFQNGFCIHSNTYVSLNSNNYFEPGTVVSMPDLAELDIPNSGFQTNAGLQAALREGRYNIRIVERVDEIIDTIDNIDSQYRPDYITKVTTKTITKKTITAADLAPNSINYWNCSAGGKGTIDKNQVIENVVILSNCEISFSTGTILQNTVIATTNTSAKSFNASSGLQVGKNDNCAAGGGAQLVTMGGMNFAASLQVYGSQLLALGDIEFAAQANGIQGAAMVSASTISGTSNMAMSFCGTGMEDNFESEYFRLTQ